MNREQLIDVIYTARWVDGIHDIGLTTDAAIADAILNKATDTKES